MIASKHAAQVRRLIWHPVTDLDLLALPVVVPVLLHLLVVLISPVCLGVLLGLVLCAVAKVFQANHQIRVCRLRQLVLRLLVASEILYGPVPLLLTGAQLDIFSLRQQIEVHGVREGGPLEQDFEALHHANHRIVVGSCLDQIGRAHLEWSENVGAHRHRDVVGVHSIVGFFGNHLSHELDDEFERDAVEFGQLVDEVGQFVDAAFRDDRRELHVFVVVGVGADRVLHLAHQLLPVVRHNMAVLNRFQVVIVVLTHVDFQLPHVTLGGGNSE